MGAGLRLVYLNPNSTAAMTDAMVQVARAALPEARIIGVTNHAGPAAIQGPADGAAAVTGMRALLPDVLQQAPDAIIIGCFDDVGLEEIRALAPCPVIGIGQASYVMAGLLGLKFSVVTTLAVSVPVIEANIARQGFAAGCVSVRPSGLPVLVVEEGGAAVLDRLGDEIGLAAGDGAGAVVLGCAGMAPLLPALVRQRGCAGVTLIEGVRAAAHLAVASVHGGGGLVEAPQQVEAFAAI